eukprot:237499_1
MQESTLFTIGCGASVGLIALSILAGYILCQKYKAFCNINRNNHRSFEEIDCHDIKMTAITLSQHSNANVNANHQRKRSQSDPDIILDSVALAIVSPEFERKLENKIDIVDNTQSPDSIESVTSLSRTDDDCERSVSPLSTPKSYTNTQSTHYRSNNLEETNKSLDNSSLMSQIINMIDSESEEVIYENKEEEENGNNVENAGRVVITRRSLCSRDNCTFTRSKGNENNEEEKKIEEHNSADDSTPTVTYNNSVEDYNKLHGIAAVPTKDSSTYIRTSLNITRRLNKLKEISHESQPNEKDESVQNNEIKVKQHLEMNKTPDVKQKISEYKKKIRELADSSGKKPRRDSLIKLKDNRMVKTRRPLFEKSSKDLS